MAEKTEKAKAFIPPPGSEERDFWIEAAIQHGFEETSGGEILAEYDPPAFFATQDEVLALMASARQQGRDDAALATPRTDSDERTAGAKAVSARTLAGMLRSRIERAAEHKSETVSLGQFFADQIHRYLTEAGHGPEHDARIGDVPADGGDPDCDSGRDWGLRARQVHLEALSKRAAGGKWFASTNGSDGLARLDNGTDGMFPVRGEWHEIEFIEALVNAYCSGDFSIPAPPAGAVPDSLREAFEAAELHECWVNGDTADVMTNPYGHCGNFDQIVARCATGDLWRKRAVAIAESLNFVRSLLASHPAGQSAGSGERIAEIVNRWHDWIVSASADMDQPEWSSGSRQTMEDDRDFLLRALPAQKPAPDSTRTGDEGTERLREAVSKALHDNQFLDGWPEMVDPVVEAVLAARPAAPEAQGAWRPISTAPRNDTLVMLGWWRDVGGDPRWIAVAGWYEAGPADQCWYAAYDEERVEPTHWQPLDRLPAPPASSGQGGR